MTKSFRIWAGLALFIAAFASLTAVESTLACGGFFCQNSPVDQNAERIIFAHNRDGTISTYVQIQYTGEFWQKNQPHAIKPILLRSLRYGESLLERFFLSPALTEIAFHYQSNVHVTPLNCFSIMTEKELRAGHHT